MSTVTEQLMTYIVETRFDDLSSQAVESTKIFVRDSFSVGVSGSRVKEQPKLIKAMKHLDGGERATVWSSGERLSVASVALINAWQIHNQEFDCVHEAAIVHPMAVILAALTAVTESQSIANTCFEPEDVKVSRQLINGKDFILALNIAVDVATTIGMCATQPMRFFRPAMCGALGAAAGIAKLLGCERDQIHNALGLTYSHLSGTMQAHTEGSPALAYQIGLNARAAVTCSFMAKENLSGPKDFLQGPFGYLSLVEGEFDLSPFQQLGKVWQMTRISHKPFPTGRAAHGVLDGIIQLKRCHSFKREQISKITVMAPPLILRLIDRPMKSTMNTSYAKLCMGYIAATWLIKGSIDVADYKSEYFSEVDRLALARKLSMKPNKVDDPNALAPQTIIIELTSGEILQKEILFTLGSPERPLSSKAQQEKFIRCCQAGREPLSDTQIDQLTKIIADLEQLPHIHDLVKLLSAKKGVRE